MDTPENKGQIQPVAPAQENGNPKSENAGVTKEQFTALTDQLSEVLGIVKRQEAELVESRQQSQVLATMVMKLNADNDATKPSIKPKFTPAKTYMTYVNGVKVRFREGLVKRGEIIAPHNKQGLSVARVRIDDIITDKGIMQKIFDQEYPILKTGAKPFGMLEIVKDENKNAMAMA